MGVCFTRYIPQVEAQHVYSTLYKESKVSYQPSCERDPSNKQVDAVYDLVTEVKQDVATL